MIDNDNEVNNCVLFTSPKGKWIERSYSPRIVLYDYSPSGDSHIIQYIIFLKNSTLRTESLSIFPDISRKSDSASRVKE